MNDSVWKRKNSPEYRTSPAVFLIPRHFAQYLYHDSKLLKVNKSQKQILKFSYEPKNEQNYFCISALASKSGWTKKI